MRLLAALVVLGLAAPPIALAAESTGDRSSTTPRPAKVPLDMSAAFPPGMQTLPLYGNDPIPNSKPGPDEESGADRGYLKKVSRPQLQIYLPARTKATGAGVLIFPGGSYGGLTFDYEGTQQAQFFIDHGIAAFVVKYRIPSDATMVDRSMGPLQDAQQAMRIVHSHASRWQLDAERIGVIGFSAGGHLASTLATHFNGSHAKSSDGVSLRPDFLILIYPVISMDSRITHKDSREALLGRNPSEEQVRLFSNELQVTGDTPPTLLLHATDDQLVDAENSIVFYQALRRAGVPVEMHMFERGQHGFFLIPRDRWQSTVIEWLAAGKWLHPREGAKQER